MSYALYIDQEGTLSLTVKALLSLLSALNFYSDARQTSMHTSRPTAAPMTMPSAAITVRCASANTTIKSVSAISAAS